MTSDIHVFTSITSNYLPKARVLAASVKRTAPEVTFHLVLSDTPPAGFNLDEEPFDNLLTIDDLAIDDREGWSFSHTVVELCTAVKGLAVETLFERYAARKVFFFDPDMVVFGRFDELAAALDTSSILLTPHQTDPELTDEAIMDNEMASLQYGVFNLGFVGVRNDGEGRRFSRWWMQRLLSYCYDDRPRGLFTDQKWVNLAPCFFDNIRVIRSPAFNVATWNITRRDVAGTLDGGITVNGEPLGFYHFSGFDSGAQETMLNKYGKDNPTLHEMRAWYIDACKAQGQQALGRLPCRFACYDDGTPITTQERILYRQRLDLQRAFPNPFSTARGGYKNWYQGNVPASVDTSSADQPAVVIPMDVPAAQVCAGLQDWLRRKALISSSGPRRWVFRLAAWVVGIPARRDPSAAGKMH